MNIDNLKADLERDEGRRPKLYVDTVSKTTIGIGRNLTDVGLSDKEIEYLLENDIQRVLTSLDAMLPWWRDLDEVRQRVLCNMCFQMGIKGLMGFTTTLGRIQAARYEDAAESMRDSMWFKQTPNRAERLARMMRDGK